MYQQRGRGASLHLDSLIWSFCGSRGRPTVPDVTSRTFNFRHAKAPVVFNKSERKGERARNCEESPGVMAIGVAWSDCRKLRGCEMHANDFFSKWKRKLYGVAEWDVMKKYDFECHFVIFARYDTFHSTPHSNIKRNHSVQAVSM